jgi:hypothetical protein
MTQILHTDLEKARQLAGTAQLCAIAALVVIAVSIADSLGSPLWGLLLESDSSWREQLRDFSLLLVGALPAILLFYAVQQLSRALKHYENGEFFGREAPERVARAGDLAVEAMLAAMVVVPSLTRWLDTRGGFDLRLEPEFIGMLAFALFISVAGRILQAAAGLKDENDAFI